MTASAQPQLVLLVTGDAPRSRRARANLAAALEGAGLGEVEPREIDLIARPDQTVAWGVFATPALIKPTGGRGSVLYGDLSDREALEHFLADLDPPA